MAVYTALGEDALVAWLARHDVGALADWRGIAAGIENSNFFVTTRRDGREHRFVLTLFERLRSDQLPYYLSLMKHLASRGVPCPEPMADRDGALFSPLAGKPATLVTRLDGKAITRPTVAHCAAIGALIARLHAAGASFGTAQPNPRGFDWWVETAALVRDHLDDRQRALLDDEITLLIDRWISVTREMPHGPVHADLFRDNALFATPTEAARTRADAALPGVIDFYFAGNDVWLLDLAIAINDWCVDLDDGALDPSRLQSLIDAYQRERPLTDAEHAALPLVLRAAALRFWLSRLDDLHRPRPAQLLTPHDPAQFERLLRMRRDDAARGWPRLDRRSLAAS